MSGSKPAKIEFHDGVAAYIATKIVLGLPVGLVSEVPAPTPRPTISNTSNSFRRCGSIQLGLGRSRRVVRDGASDSPRWAAPTATNLWSLDNPSTDEDLASVDVVIVAEVGLLIEAELATGFT